MKYLLIILLCGICLSGCATKQYYAVFIDKDGYICIAKDNKIQRISCFAVTEEGIDLYNPALKN